MPRRDGTGPIGAGTMSGRGLGLCTNKNIFRYDAGLGLACKRGFGGGFGRGFAANQNSAKINKDLLREQKELLQSRLEVIDKQLESL
ncbi:DUF5320 domain-containing protein [Clostridium sp. C105KSO13]|uniref:DUF5320 domain-containing protein n=1 Tax=Clostridium sp. C105KSO13 TaxID=1776045 RepID=UPI000740845D|nr:DUF5320 domain-containing protein [Clostridium sp. C105KSO13]CUX15250.1 hypothetical protein BN3456_00093 [Clostridium sp. C105KSO13]